MTAEAITNLNYKHIEMAHLAKFLISQKPSLRKKEKKNKIFWTCLDNFLKESYSTKRVFRESWPKIYFRENSSTYGRNLI